MPQQPQYIPPAPYHQQPIYPYPGYPQQPGQFVPMPPQQIIHQGQPGNFYVKTYYVLLYYIYINYLCLVPYTTQQPMSQPSVSQAPNQGGPKPRPGGPGGRPDRIRNQFILDFHKNLYYAEKICTFSQTDDSYHMSHTFT